MNIKEFTNVREDRSVQNGSRLCLALDQFHSPVNLAKSIVIAAAVLLECFRWDNEKYDLQHVREELADKYDKL